LNGQLDDELKYRTDEIEITETSFNLATAAEKTFLSFEREPQTYWKHAWKSLKKNKFALISLFILIFIILLCIIAPELSRYKYDEMLRGQENQSFSWNHWLGTDNLGRDLFVRIMIGTRISLLVGILAAGAIVIIGILYGAISGFIGGWVDNVMMRIVDIIYAIPTLLIVILLSVILKEPLTRAFDESAFLKQLSIFGPGLISIFIVMAALYWVDMARIVRGQVLSLKQQEYVTAARALGASNWRIITSHLIPNAMGPIIVTATFKIPTAIYVESFLSYLGLGVDVPMPSLGSLTSEALGGIYSYPEKLILPAVMISIIILCFNLLGDGLRDALDPRIKK